MFISLLLILGANTEKQFVYLRQKQGSDTHPERKGCGRLL